MQRILLLLLPILVSVSPVAGDSLPGYVETNLVSNIPGLAGNTDANLVNPWGISSTPTSPFWVSDNGTGLTTLYNSVGTPQSLVVTIPNGAPTGQVFNSTAAFNGDLFLFSSESGVITGWRGALGTTAERLFDQSATGAVYKGLALGTTAQGSYLYAADFHNSAIDVFPSSGAPGLTGKFLDPNLPAGYAPFNVQNIGGQIYVTYAKQDATGHDDVPGPGNGFVNVFDLNGNLLKRLASNGPLNSPWGLALAPAGWGGFSGDLLVGNFGDGTINAYALDGTLAGMITDAAGNPLTNDGLWALKFGNGGNGGLANSLYLTAGLNDEADGLFARIDPVPEPRSLLLAVGGMVILAALTRRRFRAAGFSENRLRSERV